MNFQLENGNLYCWQWDIRQKIEVEGLEELNLTYPVFLIGNSKDKVGLYKVVPVQAEKWYIPIPDEVLQKEGWGDVYLYDESTGTTKLTWRFTIKKKEKPQDYVYETTEFVTLMEVNLKIEEITTETIPQLRKELKQYTDEELQKAESDDLKIDKTLSKSDCAADAKTVGQKLDEKVSKIQGKGLSTNDFTDAYKSKVDSALQSFIEKDPTVPQWAKQPSKPSYTAEEVGALPANTQIPSIEGLATEKYVQSAVAGLVNSAPEALDTLGEVATALKENEDVVKALNESIGKKANRDEIPSIEGLASEIYVKNYVDNKGYTTLQEVYEVADEVAFPSIISLNDLGVTFDILISGEKIPIEEEQYLALEQIFNSFKRTLLVDTSEGDIELELFFNVFPTCTITEERGKVFYFNGIPFGILGDSEIMFIVIEVTPTYIQCQTTQNKPYINGYDLFYALEEVFDYE